MYQFRQQIICSLGIYSNLQNYGYYSGIRVGFPTIPRVFSEKKFQMENQWDQDFVNQWEQEEEFTNCLREYMALGEAFNTTMTFK